MVKYNNFNIGLTVVADSFETKTGREYVILMHVDTQNTFIVTKAIFDREVPENKRAFGQQYELHWKTYQDLGSIYQTDNENGYVNYWLNSGHVTITPKAMLKLTEVQDFFKK